MRLFLPAAALLLSSCTASTLSPDAHVSVTGHALTAEGQPLSGAKALLYKEPDVGEQLLGLAEVGASWGAVCFASDPPAICESIPAATTDAAGKYDFSMLGKDTQGTGGSASTFDLTVRRPAQSSGLEGPVAQAQFLINAETLLLPDLKLWEPSVAFSVTDGQAAVTFTTFAGNGTDTGRGTGYLLQSGAGEVVWASAEATSGSPFDVRILEDSEGVAIGTAHSTGKLPNGDPVRWSFRSKQVAYPASSGAPPSRGAHCFAHGASGPVELTACPLTDGHFATAYPAVAEPACPSGTTTCDATANNWAYVDLGESRSVDLVVVRGLTSAFLIDTSSDATTWSSLTRGEGGPLAYSPFLPVTTRYVRIRAAEATGHVTGLAEVSIW